MTLDELGILCGTDKSSLRKAYLSHYERLFAPLRDTAFNLIEIGAYNGVSLRTWAEYFPRAFIVGIDIEPNAAKLAEDRIAVRIGSQADAQFLTGVAAEFPPLIVVDDGSHQADHQIASFACLFPKLRPGGCYVCEDLTAIRTPRFLGASPTPAAEYFARVAKSDMERAQTDSEAVGAARLDVFPGAIAIWKAEAPNPLSGIEQKADLAARSARPEALLHLADYLIRRGSGAAAVEAARRAIDRLPQNLWSHATLARALSKAGDKPAAIAAAQEAVKLRPDQPFFAELLKNVLVRTRL